LILIGHDNYEMIINAVRFNVFFKRIVFRKYIKVTDGLPIILTTRNVELLQKYRYNNENAYYIFEISRRPN